MLHALKHLILLACDALLDQCLLDSVKDLYRESDVHVSVSFHGRVDLTRQPPSLLVRQSIGDRGSELQLSTSTRYHHFESFHQQPSSKHSTPSVPKAIDSRNQEDQA